MPKATPAQQKVIDFATEHNLWVEKLFPLSLNSKNRYSFVNPESKQEVGGNLNPLVIEAMVNNGTLIGCGSSYVGMTRHYFKLAK